MFLPPHARSATDWPLRPRDGNGLGPDVDEVIANLDLPIADFNAALANSLAEAINHATQVALFKARWLNRAMILAVVTILFLSLARLGGSQ